MMPPRDIACHEQTGGLPQAYITATLLFTFLEHTACERNNSWFAAHTVCFDNQQVFIKQQKFPQFKNRQNIVFLNT